MFLVFPITLPQVRNELLSCTLYANKRQATQQKAGNTAKMAPFVLQTFVGLLPLHIEKGGSTRITMRGCWFAFSRPKYR